MRLWTLHPQYLDTKGLLAVWREALLAQKVLKGETKGYRNHPQLDRFKAEKFAVNVIATYLRGIHQESLHRGYQFDASKIDPGSFRKKIRCTRGQLLYEWDHLKKKLKTRDPQKYKTVELILEPQAHPLFLIIAGDVEAWEIRVSRD